MPEVEIRLPVWAQMVIGAWLLGLVAMFLRQILVGYMAALGGG